jgi:hypothetical protein
MKRQFRSSAGSARAILGGGSEGGEAPRRRIGDGLRDALDPRKVLGAK